MNTSTLLLLAFGGALGTLARVGLGLWAAPFSAALPWGTILTNGLGSFAIGFFGTLTLAQGRYPVSEPVRLFVMAGFCGGFTTFSSFSLQTLDLMRGGGLNRALVNVGLSVGLCLASVALGHALASRLNGGAADVAQVRAEKDA